MTPSRALAVALHCLLVLHGLFVSTSPLWDLTRASVSRSLDKLGNLLEGTIIQGGGRRGSNPALSELTRVLLLRPGLHSLAAEGKSGSGRGSCAVVAPGWMWPRSRGLGLRERVCVARRTRVGVDFSLLFRRQLRGGRERDGALTARSTRGPQLNTGWVLYLPDWVFEKRQTLFWALRADELILTLQQPDKVDALVLREAPGADVSFPRSPDPAAQPNAVSP